MKNILGKYLRIIIHNIQQGIAKITIIHTKKNKSELPYVEYLPHQGKFLHFVIDFAKKELSSLHVFKGNLKEIRENQVSQNIALPK